MDETKDCQIPRLEVLDCQLNRHRRSQSDPLPPNQLSNPLEDCSTRSAWVPNELHVDDSCDIPQTAYFVHLVQSDDNLHKLAVRYDTTVAAIRRLNPRLIHDARIWPAITQLIIPTQRPLRELSDSAAYIDTNRSAPSTKELWTEMVPLPRSRAEPISIGSPAEIADSGTGKRMLECDPVQSPRDPRHFTLRDEI